VTNFGKVVLLLGLMAAGFVIGRMSGGDAGLRRAVQDYRDSAAVWREERAALGRTVAARGDTIRRLDSSVVRLRVMAAGERREAALAKLAADSLRAIRLATTDPVLRLQACEAEVVEREREATACGRAVGQLEVALDTAQEGAARRDLTITDLVRGRARDSSQIASAESVIGRLERAARGCRVPLVGLRCPVGTVSWDTGEIEVLPRYFTVSYPVRPWLQVGVTWARKP